MDLIGFNNFVFKIYFLAKYILTKIEELFFKKLEGCNWKKKKLKDKKNKK